MSLQSAAELYVHAIAIEREAAERYAEFAGRMASEDNYKVAAFFRMLSTFEAKHLAELKRRIAGVELPPLTSDYSWLDEGASETAGRELIFRAMTPRHALAIALHAEKRARAFFEHVCRTAADPATRSLAKEMAMEEAEHISLVERMLDRCAASGTPAPGSWSAPAPGW
jgi:rubrerythrin